MGRDIDQSILLRRRIHPPFLRERQLSPLLHPTLAAGPTGEVEEEAMEAVMDEAVVAGMEEDLESLELNSYTPVRLFVPTPSHLTCNCGSSKEDATYRQCLVSHHRATTYCTALTLFDTGAYTSFVNCGWNNN